MTVAAVVVALVIAFGPLGRAPGPDFYGAAAQIIPILLVALAVESSARDLWDVVPRWVRLTTFLTLSAGQTSAVLAASGVLKPERNVGDNFLGPTVATTLLMIALTVASLIVGFFLVMYVAFFRHPTSAGSADVGTTAGTTTAPNARYIRR